ncbi:MAG: 2,3-bisphosphoglycerate-independent phosphoglycerate mutase [Thermodesulfobacteriota bacterium]|nr:2,3-bisphosphoglycerate-independent phosphoglycerate mutase [Thermodesulfobacteriota bacterium]
MNQIDLMRQLHVASEKKIVLLIMDGLGGLPDSRGKTELEAADTPNMDALAKKSILGLSTSASPGITPGSGPGHMSLFGYDPMEYSIGRGVLEALGIGLELNESSLAARGNFCSLDPASGVITDRRAGRIPTTECKRLVDMLSEIRLDGVNVHIHPVIDYRFVLVLEGEGLGGNLGETDPQKTGLKPLEVKALDPGSSRSADLLNQWLSQAFEIIRDQRPANGCTLRGIAKDPGLPSYEEIYGLNAAAIAAYPMYKGIARLVGMDILDAGNTVESELEALKRHWNDGHDFFFFHVKKTDSAGEDGDFDEKVKVIEQTDRIIPDIMDLNPDVLMITGDHSTPARLKGHSWHELPFVLYANNIRHDPVTQFGETACIQGGLGHIRHVDIMPLAMAHADKLAKYGA